MVTSEFLGICSGVIEDFALLGCSSVAGYVVPKVSKQTFAYILMDLESLKTKATLPSKCR